MRTSLRTLIALVGGAVALAVHRKATEPEPMQARYSEAATKIHIVGGGFGELAAARELSRALGTNGEAGVGLIDWLNHTTF
jgi:heterodisulfide reductase subunit A-like polyferredoxin